ncbi:hypothetical protein PRUB_b1087 [Pseudoalteromonas rubra]|uniref:Uncharacterized protein n=1 Tax=Pseudoalteromonas rubra TaxID=43658 RepID=A0A8T0C175_9GAMM|nr:hypothetical protein PRUB_b1087 [Pseudoalteromonas rubra]
MSKTTCSTRSVQSSLLKMKALSLIAIGSLEQAYCPRAFTAPALADS